MQLAGSAWILRAQKARPQDDKSYFYLANSQDDDAVDFVFALGAKFQDDAVAVWVTSTGSPPSSNCADEILPAIGGRASSGDPQFRMWT